MTFLRQGQRIRVPLSVQRLVLWLCILQSSTVWGIERKEAGVRDWYAAGLGRAVVIEPLPQEFALRENTDSLALVGTEAAAVALIDGKGSVLWRQIGPPEHEVLDLKVGRHHVAVAFRSVPSWDTGVSLSLNNREFTVAPHADVEISVYEILTGKLVVRDVTTPRNPEDADEQCHKGTAFAFAVVPVPSALEVRGMHNITTTTATDALIVQRGHKARLRALHVGWADRSTTSAEKGAREGRTLFTWDIPIAMSHSELLVVSQHTRDWNNVFLRMIGVPMPKHTCPEAETNVVFTVDLVLSSSSPTHVPVGFGAAVEAFHPPAQTTDSAMAVLSLDKAMTLSHSDTAKGLSRMTFFDLPKEGEVGKVHSIDVSSATSNDEELRRWRLVGTAGGKLWDTGNAKFVVLTNNVDTIIGGLLRGREDESAEWQVSTAVVNGRWLPVARGDFSADERIYLVGYHPTSKLLSLLSCSLETTVVVKCTSPEEPLYQGPSWYTKAERGPLLTASTSALLESKDDIAYLYLSSLDYSFSRVPLVRSSAINDANMTQSGSVWIREEAITAITHVKHFSDFASRRVSQGGGGILSWFRKSVAFFLKSLRSLPAVVKSPESPRFEVASTVSTFTVVPTQSDEDRLNAALKQKQTALLVDKLMDPSHVIVAATCSGKVYGFSALTGILLWQRQMSSFNENLEFDGSESRCSGPEGYLGRPQFGMGSTNGELPAEGVAMWEPSLTLERSAPRRRLTDAVSPPKTTKLSSLSRFPRSNPPVQLFKLENLKEGKALVGLLAVYVEASRTLHWLSPQTGKEIKNATSLVTLLSGADLTPKEDQRLLVRQMRTREGEDRLVMVLITGTAEEEVNWRGNARVVLLNAEGSLLEAAALSDTEKDFTFQLFNVDVRENQLKGGFAAFLDGQRNAMTLNESWKVNVTGQILAVAAPLHAQFGAVPIQVRGDASVLYKFLSPSLLGVLVASLPEEQLYVRVINTANGELLVNEALPEGASLPARMVMTENVMVLSYWNERSVRYELHTLELFHNKKDEGPWKLLFAATLRQLGLLTPRIAQACQPFKISSAHDLEKPIVLSRTYSTGGVRPQSLTFTASLEGLTPKGLVMSLSSSQIYVLPEALYNSRRPYPARLLLEDQEQTRKMTTAQLNGLMKLAKKDKLANSPDAGDEMALPYSPQMPLQATSIVSHEHQVEQVRALTSYPAPVESGSFVFAFGLDLFGVLLQPAMSYDTLSPRHTRRALLAAIMTALIVAAGLTRSISQKRQATKDWR